MFYIYTPNFFLHSSLLAGEKLT